MASSNKIKKSPAEPSSGAENYDQYDHISYENITLESAHINATHLSEFCLCEKDKDEHDQDYDDNPNCGAYCYNKIVQFLFAHLREFTLLFESGCLPRNLY